MAQNRSTAVMQRRCATDDRLNYFPTPPWATRALTEWLAAETGEDLSGQSAWEPACGEGHMVRPLLEVFGAVRASDVARYGMIGGLGDHELVDFVGLPSACAPQCDWVITNPPFVLGEAFVAAAMRSSRKGFALLVRSAFVEGEERYRDLFALARPTSFCSSRSAL